ncbi:glycogenin-2 isoform X4 [Zalophus californianus]|uniref:glycogenin glucosyltransferase n=1 Tax=Zalophus californianus TaxID=9704 RepID=A0A6J2ED27_ZALCA|nr:glycogenin-2 isoform X4 [Zalophus californianus]
MCSKTRISDQAFVTLATNDIYCQGALVLGQSLRNQRATRKLVVLITPQVSSLLRVILTKVFDEVIEVNLIDSADYIHLAFLKRPELGVTLTKLHCWTLTHYSKCVFLDADTLPSLETHGLLLQHATDHGSFDGADQGLLNSFFSSWSTADIHKHLPFIYNLSSNNAYTYSPAFKRFGSSVKVVHFLGPTKPWNYKYNPQMEGSGLANQHQASFLNLWWKIYQHSVLPLYGSFRDEEEHASPGHSAGIGEPCAKPAVGSSHPWPAEGPSEQTMVTDDTPPSPKGCHSEDTIGWPELETSAGVRCDPLSPPSPQCTDSSGTQTTSQPMDKGEGDPSVEILEPSQEPPVDVTGDSSPQDALEVDLAMSVYEISIEEKVKEPSPEEERRKWEEGRIDYMGKDAFARIQEKLDRFLQ